MTTNPYRSRTDSSISMAPLGWESLTSWRPLFSISSNRATALCISDCRAALDNPFQWIQRALLFAFYGDSELYHHINEAENMDGLIPVVAGRYQLQLYLIVDQQNGLEIDVDKKDLQESTKTTMYSDLAKIGAFQKYIFSASAGAESNRNVDSKQSGIEVIHFNAGTTPVRPHFSEHLVLHSLG